MRVLHHYHYLSRYHVEAKDNAKFLGSIEKNSHSIYLQVTYHTGHTLL